MMVIGFRQVLFLCVASYIIYIYRERERDIYYLGVPKNQESSSN